MKRKEKFWFYLEPYIYVAFKPAAVLLYNTRTGKKLIAISSIEIRLLQRIYEDKNLGSIELSDRELSLSEVYQFVEKVTALGMGKLINKEIQQVKPIVLLPIVSLNFDIEKLKEKENAKLYLTKDVGKYLLELNIVLNGVCHQKCKHCFNYRKQFFCCHKGTIDENLDTEGLKELLRQVSFLPIRTIKITGGNIYQYNSLGLFGLFGNDGKKILNFYVNYLNYRENQYVDKHRIHIILNTPLISEKLAKVVSLTRNKDVRFHLVIEDIEQYQILESALTEFGITDFDIHPFYNGHNMSFFEESVFLSEEDILSSPISMREIFCNQKLNINSFGSLYILPNGDVKANQNQVVLGNIKENKIVDIIGKEMLENTAWRQVRSMLPCSNCVYQYLCPPPSDYERIIERPNLCHVAIK